MNSNVTSPNASANVGLHPRLVSLLGLAAVVAGLGYIARGGYYAATDSWVAPVTLSPDSDAVVDNNVRLNEHLARKAKLESDIARIDADVLGVERAMRRLQALHQNGQKALKWAARSTGQQAEASAASARSLEAQHRRLGEMMVRQQEAVARVQRNVEAGLASALELDREQQNVSELQLAIDENERRSADLRAKSEESSRAAGALRAVAEAPNGADAAYGVLPEVAISLERDVNVELGIARLESERRALLNEKTLATENLARLDDVLKQLKNRPLYRAIVASTDIAFVPYTQIEGVTPGVELVTCTWALFRCRTVGRVTEVLPGEVTAPDAWGKVSRGQYAVLELVEHDAAREKLLRARTKTP